MASDGKAKIKVTLLSNIAGDVYPSNLHNLGMIRIVSHQCLRQFPNQILGILLEGHLDNCMAKRSKYLEAVAAIDKQWDLMIEKA